MKAITRLLLEILCIISLFWPLVFFTSGIIVDLSFQLYAASLLSSVLSLVWCLVRIYAVLAGRRH